MKKVFKIPIKKNFSKTILKRKIELFTNEELKEEIKNNNDNLLTVLYLYKLNFMNEAEEMIKILEDSPLKSLVEKLFEKDYNIDTDNLDIKKSDFKLAFILFEIGRIAFEKNELDAAHDIFIASHTSLLNDDQNSKKVQNLKRLIMNYLGQVYFLNFDQSLSIPSYETIINEGGIEQDDILSSEICSNMSLAQLIKMDFNSAEKYSELAMEKLKSKEKNEDYYKIITRCYFIYFSIEKFKGDIKKSLEYAEKGIQASKEGNLLSKEIEFLQVIAFVYVEQGKIEETEKMIKNIEEMISDLRDELDRKTLTLKTHQLKTLMYKNDPENLIHACYDYLKFIFYDEISDEGTKFQLINIMTLHLTNLNNVDLTQEMDRKLTNLEIIHPFLHILGDQLVKRGKYQECLDEIEKIEENSNLPRDVRKIKDKCLIELGRGEEVGTKCLIL